LNLILFFIIWAIIWYIPIPPTKFKLLSIRRLSIFGVGLFLFAINALALTPFSSFVYFLIFSRAFVALAEYFIPSAPIAFEQYEVEGRSGKFFKVNIKLKQKKALIALLSIAIFVVSLFGMVAFGEIQRVANANYFNGLVQEGSGLPFNSTIPDNMVRLVTEELATSIARRHMSEFGSNTQILDCHVTKSPEGRLVWIATIGSTNIIAENYVKGFVIVDANEPTATPEIVHTEFNVGEGLWWDRNIPFRNYLEDMTKTYGVSYMTYDLDSNNPVYVVTRSILGFDLVKRYETPLSYDSQGTAVNAPTSLAEIPDWMTQIYDEDWLEAQIDEMGSFRRENTFDYFAGGFLWFVAPSRDRFQMTEDTRYIVDPESGDVVALVCVNPMENQRTLSGVFKATREGIIFYDFKLSNYISGMTAEDLVEGRLPKPATGNYYAIMPLLYSIETSPGNYRLAWYVPIYWYEDSLDTDETIYLAGFAIVDAQDTNKISSIMNGEGITSEEMIRQTRLDFINLFGDNTTSVLELNATVLDKYEYVQDGSTHIVLHTNNNSYQWIEATSVDLSAQEWNQLLSTQPNQEIIARIEERDSRYMITYFALKNQP
jgi:hypothetical protein